MEPTLYLIMRADIPDLNPGKLAAQASHVTSDFDAYVQMVETPLFQKVDLYSTFLQAVNQWKEERNFGRCIVLYGSLEEIKEVIKFQRFSGLTTDPSYPWQNWYGDTFLSDMVTGSWCFVYDGYTPTESLTKLNLHP